MQMVELLARAGYKAEAKQTLQVVLLFPTYADKFYAGVAADLQVTTKIVADAETAPAVL